MAWPVRHISRFIDRAPSDVLGFLGDPKNLPQWAAGLSTGIRQEKGVWVSDSPMGQVEIRFAAPNQLGVLDHDVKLPNGETVHNPMRVLPNGRGSEVLFSVFGRDGMSEEELEKDCRMVAADLETAKALLEKM